MMKLLLILVGFFFACCLKECSSLTSITTDPLLRNNVLATGFPGLSVTATFPKTSSTINCRWKVNEASWNFHSEGIECFSFGFIGGNIVCMEQEIAEQTHIITTWKTNENIESDLVIDVQCNEGRDRVIGLPAVKVRECNNDLAHNVSVQSSSSGYNAKGTFICPVNKTLIDSTECQPKLSSTTCLYTAEWSGTYGLQCWRENVTFVSTTTIPSTPHNVLATGYPDLVIRSMFVERNGINNCQWKRNGKNQRTYPQFLVAGLGCVNRSEPNQFTITCVEEDIYGVTVIVTNLRYLQPLTSDLDVSVRCSVETECIKALPTKAVRECSKYLPNNVTVQASSNTYGAVGNFTCSNGKKLFYSNTSQPTTHKTTCLYKVEWSGQNNLQCWTAPSVTAVISDNDTVLEGNNISLRCEYNDVIPAGNTTIFYFDGSGAIKKKGEPFTILSLQASDNNKQVSCQAVTPYTRVYNESGRSPNHTINVHYAPFNETPNVCTWEINREGQCNIEFMSNPTAIFVALTKNNSILNFTNSMNKEGLISVSEFKQEFVFMVNEVSFADQGVYTLLLNSSIFPNKHTITFEIKVTNETEIPFWSSPLYLPIVLATSGALLIIVVVILMMCCKQGKSNMKMEGENNQNGVKLSVKGEDDYFDICLDKAVFKKAQQTSGPEYLEPIKAKEGQASYIEFEVRSSNNYTHPPAEEKAVYVDTEKIDTEELTDDKPHTTSNRKDTKNAYVNEGNNEVYEII